MKVDYSKTIIYKLCCKDISVKDIYVGATTDMKSRKTVHKSVCYNTNRKDYNLKLYEYIREQGGFSNWDMIMIEKYPCKDKLESGKRERYWIEELGATLNKQVPSRTPKEYHKDNKEYRNEYTRQYHKDNKENIRQQLKQYRKDNKEKIKQYRKDNREKIRQQTKQYRKDNKEKLQKKSKEYIEKNIEKIRERQSTKYTCECGSTITKKSKARHERTQKHINFINNQT